MVNPDTRQKMIAALARELRDVPYEERPITDPQQLAELLHSDSTHFLDSLNVPAEFRHIYGPLLERDGPQNLFYRAGMASLLNLGWDPSPHRLYQGKERKFFEKLVGIGDRHARFGLTMPEDGRTIRQDGKRIRLFPATFQLFPYEFAKKIDGVPKECHILAMYLPEDEMLAIRNEVKRSFNEHVPNAFGYIRFYERHSADIYNSRTAYLIAEIQNDFYGKLESPSLARKYKHWSQQLMLAFEWYHLQMSDFMIEHMRRFEEFGGKRASAVDARKVVERLRKELGTDDLGLFNALDDVGNEGLFEALGKALEEAQVVRSVETETPGHIFLVATSQTIKDRWPNNERQEELEPGERPGLGEGGIADALADRLYRQLPLFFDYHLDFNPLGRTFPERYIDPNADGDLKKATLGVKIDALTVWKRSATRGELRDQSRWLGQAHKLFSLHDSVEIQVGWDERREDFFPPEFFEQLKVEGAARTHPVKTPIIIEGRDVTADLCPYFDFAPITSLPMDTVPTVRREWIKTWAEELASGMYDSALELSSPYFMPISKGIENGISDKWWEWDERPGTEPQVMPLHLLRQNNRPIFRVTQTARGSSPLLCLGMRGAGARVIEEGSVRYYNPERERLPIQLGNMRQQVERGHFLIEELWGGNTLGDAMRELTYAMALLHLQRHASPEARLGTALPIDVSILESIPFLTEKGTDWYGSVHYSFRHLENPTPDSADRLAVYRSASECDVRMIEIADRALFQPLDLDKRARGEQVGTALRFLYRVNGESLSFPKGAIEGQVFDLLKAINRENKSAAMRIHRRIMSRLMNTVGLVHGAGGHLGGDWNSEGQAFAGGSTGAYSIDATGMMHDFNMWTYLPWVGNILYSREQLNKQREVLPAMQVHDLASLTETRLFLDALLLGKWDEAERIFWPFVVYNRAVDAGFNRTATSDAFDLEMHAETYSRAVQLGRTYRREIDPDWRFHIDPNAMTEVFKMRYRNLIAG